MVLLGWCSRGIGDGVNLDDPTWLELKGRKGCLDVELQMVLLCWSSRGIGHALDLEYEDGLTLLELEGHRGCP